MKQALLAIITAFILVHAAQAAEADDLAQFQELAEVYLGSPESAMYDEGLYLALLQRLATSSSLTPDLRMRVEYQVSMLSKNSPGTIAADFTFTTADGPRTLHSTVDRPTILLLYDPECSHCQEVIATLVANELIAERVAAGTLTLLAINIEPTSAAPALPAGWLYGEDSSDIIATDTYYLQAPPAIYLLAPDATVLLKNPSPATLHTYLLQ